MPQELVTRRAGGRRPRDELARTLIVDLVELPDDQSVSVATVASYATEQRVRLHAEGQSLILEIVVAIASLSTRLTAPSTRTVS